MSDSSKHGALVHAIYYYLTVNYTVHFSFTSSTIYQAESQEEEASQHLQLLYGEDLRLQKHRT